MADTNATFPGTTRAQRATTTLTIANGTATSGEVDARGYEYLGLVMPAAFTGASISFTVSEVSGGTFQALYDTSNTLVSVTVGASRSYDLPSALRSWPFWKIVSASNEAADRTLQVVAKA